MGDHFSFIPDPVSQENKDLYNRFADEINTKCSYQNRTFSFSQDTRYYFDLQKKKAFELGVEIEEQLSDSMGLNDIYGTSYKGDKYISNRLFHNYIRTTSYLMNGKEINKQKEKVILYAFVTNYIRGKINAEENYCCPNCGTVTTINTLQKGCPYCGTKFIMSDLFPKITNFFYIKDFSLTKGECIRNILTNGFIVYLIGIIYIYFSYKAGYRINQGQSLNEALKNFIFSLPLAVPILGFFSYPFFVIIRLFSEGAKSIPLLLKSIGAKGRLVGFMRRYDSNFSFELFESKIVSMLKVMIYCEKNDLPAMYDGKVPLQEYCIIDSLYRGKFAINSMKDDGKYIELNLDVFMSDTYLSNNRIRKKNDIFRMVVVKSNSQKTDNGFSITKVACHSCGASFDATRDKYCPYCKSEYTLKEDDWVVRELVKRS